MKNIILLIAFLCMASCSSRISKYEKVIADAVQTDRGVKLDLNFKAEKIEELKKVSVADSIEILTETFNTGKNKKITTLEETVRRNIDNINKEKGTRYPSRTMISFYQSNIDKANGQIDALRGMKPTETLKYEGRNGDEILAIVVRCSYSIDEPLTKKRATETFDFYLSPDGTKYYSKKRVKE